MNYPKQYSGVRVAHRIASPSLEAILRRIAIIVLVLLPFQALPRTLRLNDIISAEYQPLIDLLSYIDESASIILLVFALSFAVLRPRAERATKYPHTKWIVGFIALSLVSMLVNRVPLVQGWFGIYDYLKNIMVAYIYAMLGFDEDDYRRAVRYLISAGVVMAVVGVFGEVLALYFEKGLNLLVFSEKRYGLYRVISLAGYGSWNYLGIYAIFLFFLAKSSDMSSMLTRKTQLFLLAFLIMFSLSRQVWLGFLVMTFLISRKANRWVAVLLVIISLVLSSNYYEEIIDIVLEGIPSDASRYFRLYAFNSSLMLLQESPFIGAGPSMFGGLASILYQSPIYDQWPLHFKKFAYAIRGIDQFWPVVWGETGLLGIVCYLMILVGLYRGIESHERRFASKGDAWLAKQGRVLRTYILPIVIMGFAGGLNAAFVSYTFFAMVGMFFSLRTAERPG